MTNQTDYYANYGGQSVHDYVEQHIRGSADEMARIRRTAKLVPAGTRSVLDVGAGHGVLLELLRDECGVPGVGIEITATKVDYGRSRGLDIRLGDAARLEFPDAGFDVVIAGEVLEHLPCGTYEAALREFARVAASSIVITVPFDERRSHVRCPYCDARVNPDYHFRSFAPARLGNLFPGFALVEWQGWGERRNSALLRLARRLRGSWPALLVCPCCGYAAPPSQPGAEAAPSTLRRLAAWVPARRQPAWLVGVFRRSAVEGGVP